MEDRSHQGSARPATAAALQAVSLSKSYGAVEALTDVSLRFEQGRVTALLGENGAGKSTLIRICSGEVPPTKGHLLVRGTPCDLASPLVAARLGISVVHQEPQLVSQMTVAENIFLAGLGSRTGLSLHRPSVFRDRARQLLERLGLANEFPEPDRRCAGLSAAERQLVEIAKSLAGDPHLVFLDEPNSSLTRRETERLFAIIRALRERGTAVVLVSHRLGEVYEVAEEVIVMRDGRKVGESSAKDLPKETAIRLMAGQRLSAVLAAAPDERHAPTAAATTLSVRGLTGVGFQDVDLDVAAGEIVGMAGMVGSGRSEIVRTIIGADPLLGGAVTLNGRAVRFTTPSAALKGGIAFISEERRTSVFYGHDIGFNVTSNVLDRFGRWGFFGEAARRRFAQASADRIGVKAHSVATPIRALSGGNQQKVLLARALASQPSLLILDEPTRGVDVRTKAEMYQIIRHLAHVEGLAVLFVSSELDEILQLSDRIVVVRGGRVVDTIAKGPEATRVVASALGESVQDAAIETLSA